MYHRPEEFQKNIILDLFFLIVIIARWCAPKGKITLEELSKLLLLYVSIIADIIDMMKMIRDLKEKRCDVKYKKELFIIGCFFLSFSILELCLGLSATRISPSKTKNKFCKSFRKVPTIIINDRVDNKAMINIKMARLAEDSAKLISKFFVQFFEKEIWSKID